MKKLIIKRHFSVAAFLLVLSACNDSKNSTPQTTLQQDSEARGKLPQETLPAPFATESAKNYSKIVGWKEGEKPIAPAGFTVTRFADELDNPRWIYVGPNGDIFVAESSTEVSTVKKIGAKISGKAKSQNIGESADRITLFRDANKDGVPESRSIFLEDLNQPFGMLILNNNFYVANTDGLKQYPYTAGMQRINDTGRTILPLPAGGYNNHWTRNVIANEDGKKLYITVGSGSNVAEHGLENEVRRANILEANPDGSGSRVYASGLRNPVGIALAPGSTTVFAAVNERDDLGDELVPDYLTSVKEGGFYGWPFSYWGSNEDPRMKDKQNPELVKKAIVPDVALGAHTASLGLAFNNGTSFPEQYRNGAFITQHGSWNRSQLSGYKVVFVPFEGGKPSGKPMDFLTGFIKDASTSEVHGRPVGIAFLADGSMLVSDDSSNTIWRVQAATSR